MGLVSHLTHHAPPHLLVSPGMNRITLMALVCHSTAPLLSSPISVLGDKAASDRAVSSSLRFNHTPSAYPKLCATKVMFSSVATPRKPQKQVFT